MHLVGIVTRIVTKKLRHNLLFSFLRVLEVKRKLYFFLFQLITWDGATDMKEIKFPGVMLFFSQQIVSHPAHATGRRWSNKLFLSLPVLQPGHIHSDACDDFTFPL